VDVTLQTVVALMIELVVVIRVVVGGHTGVEGRGLRVLVKVVQVIVEKLPQVRVLDGEPVPSLVGIEAAEVVELG